MKRHMALDVTLFRTSKTTNLSGSVAKRKPPALKDCLDSIIAEIVPVHWTISTREYRGGEDKNK
jgi:hypothetical protein